MFYTYILHSAKLNKFYIGQTNNLDQRLYFHNKGHSIFTSTGIPWILVWYDSKSTRKAAISLERKLKNLTRKRKVRLMRKYKEGIVDLELFNQLFPVNNNI